jgi:RND family efflux transporter MFP subunit
MKNKRLGTIVGSILALGGLVWIFFFRPEPVVVEKQLLVRPIKSLVVGEARGSFERTYPGRVDAIDTALISFEVPGNLQKKLVKQGDQVKAGQLLAELNPTDFQSRLTAAQAQQTRAKADLARVRALFTSGNAAAADVEVSQATFKVADADLQQAQKALADTKLTARFAGIIADDYPDQFENVTAGQAIYRLQSENSGLQIKVQVPENHVANANMGKLEEKTTAVATFEFLPNRDFPLELKDFASIADPSTQTFEVSFRMGDIGETNILPGMSSTVRVTIDPELYEVPAGLYAPLNAVPPDGSGQFFVWKLEEIDGGEFTAKRADVTVGEMQGDEILITGGLAKGERIATAGVRVLREGQVVKLLEE